MMLSVALFVMSFTAIPVAKAEEANCCCAEVYSSYEPIAGKPSWYYFEAYIITNCPVKWAALWVELWIDGVHIPPIDVPNPFYVEFQATSVVGYAYTTCSCPSSCNCDC